MNKANRFAFISVITLIVLYIVVLIFIITLDHYFQKHHYFLWSSMIIPTILVVTQYRRWFPVLTILLLENSIEYVYIYVYHYDSFGSEFLQFFFSSALNSSIVLIITYYTIKSDNMINKLEELTMTDSLTNIYNRRFFDITLKAEITSSKLNNDPLQLIFMDIDYFKLLNDSHGHGMGDKVLKEIARSINELNRNTDFFARIGGEEFALILPKTSHDEAMIIANQIREKIELKKIKCGGNKFIQITLSFGVAEYDYNITEIEFLKKADKALYHSKESGRNKVTSCFA